MNAIDNPAPVFSFADLMRETSTDTVAKALEWLETELDLEFDLYVGEADSLCMETRGVSFEGGLTLALLIEALQEIEIELLRQRKNSNS